MDVRLPKLGEGADSGSVVSILVKEGDQITQGQTLLELENEKAVAPIPSPSSGTVTKIRVKQGDNISVGQVILTLDEGSGGKPAAKHPEKDAKKDAKPKPPGKEPDASEEESELAEKEGGEDTGKQTEEEPVAMEAKPGVAPAASPSIRKIARELGIDLQRIRGSERGGRIVMADLKAYIQRLQKLSAQPKASAAKPGAPAPPPVESIDFSRWGPITKKPFSPLRQTISRRMLENWNSIPHVTQFDEADITELMELRKKFSAAYEAKGARLTLTCLVLKAVVSTLKKHLIFNASLDEAGGEIVFKQYYHIGLAVDTEAGLIVPVIRDVDKRNLLELSLEINNLAEKARNRKVSLEEMRGGTFTISNQGGIGGAHFTPIVNKPEGAILGLGRGVFKPVVKDNKIERRLLLPLCLSYDHRLIDGGQAARFIVDLVQAFAGLKEEDIKI